MASEAPVKALTYRWEYKTSEWTPLSLQDCQRIESALNLQQQPSVALNASTKAYKYGDAYKLIINNTNVHELRRSDTFEGKILGVNRSCKHGFVESNFANARSLGLKFYFSDCAFNANALAKGHAVRFKVKHDQKQLRAHSLVLLSNISNSNSKHVGIYIFTCAGIFTILQFRTYGNSHCI